MLGCHVDGSAYSLPFASGPNESLVRFGAGPLTELSIRDRTIESIFAALSDPDLADIHDDIQRALMEDRDHDAILHMIRQRSKPRKCTFFVKGTCKFGDACKLSHDVEDHTCELSQNMNSNEQDGHDNEHFLPSISSMLDEKASGAGWMRSPAPAPTCIEGPVKGRCDVASEGALLIECSASFPLAVPAVSGSFGLSMSSSIEGSTQAAPEAETKMPA